MVKSCDSVIVVASEFGRNHAGHGRAEPHKGRGVELLPASHLERDLVERLGDVVPLPLVLSHRLVQRFTIGETGVDGVDKELDVAEGVGNAEAGAEIAVIASVADERPAGAIRLAEEVGLVGGADELLTLASPDLLAEPLYEVTLQMASGETVDPEAFMRFGAAMARMVPEELPA